MKKNSNTYKLAVCAIMVALGAVLSLVKVVQMPFGGSVTLLSMPVSYTHLTLPTKA